MAIPSWAVILDNEIDPESPLTASLMQRLRDNPLAIMGIDPADPAPVMTLPPSAMAVAERFVHRASFVDNSTDTATERKVGIIANPVEDCLVTYGEWTATLSDAYLVVWSGTIETIEVIWSAGAPEEVHISGYTSATSTYGTPPTFAGAINDPLSVSPTAAVVPLTNTWTTISSIDVQYAGGNPHSTIQAKARSDADYVYLQFRTLTNNFSSVSGAFNIRTALRYFKNKAAV